MPASIEIKIRGYHADMFGHVNHARYLEFMEEGRWNYFEKRNLFNAFHERKIGHVVVNIIQDIVQVETGILLLDAQVTDVFFSLDTKETLPVKPNLVVFWPDLATLCIN